MGCCSSFKFDPPDSSLALVLTDPPPDRPRELDGFADVSLDSHSESAGSFALDTQPVFLMNSGLLPSSSPFYKDRSLSIVGPSPHLLSWASPDPNSHCLPTDRPNTRSVCYTSVPPASLLFGFTRPSPEAVPSTRASAASSFHSPPASKLSLA